MRRPTLSWHPQAHLRIAHLLRQAPRIAGRLASEPQLRSALASARMAHGLARASAPYPAVTLAQPPAGGAYPLPPQPLHTIAQAEKPLLKTRLPKLPKVP